MAESFAMFYSVEASYWINRNKQILAMGSVGWPVQTPSWTIGTTNTSIESAASKLFLTHLFLLKMVAQIPHTSGQRIWGRAKRKDNREVWKNGPNIIWEKQA